MPPGILTISSRDTTKSTKCLEKNRYVYKQCLLLYKKLQQTALDMTLNQLVTCWMLSRPILANMLLSLIPPTATKAMGWFLARIDKAGSDGEQLRGMSGNV